MQETLLGCKGIFLGYVPHTNRLMLFYDEGSNQVKIITHSTFDEGFNDLPIDVISTLCQQFCQLNKNEHPPPDGKFFFVYPFIEKEDATIPVLLDTKDSAFEFELKDDEFYGCTYICDIKDTFSSGGAKSFGTCKHSCDKFWVAYITHINNDPVISTAQAVNKLKSMYEQFLKDNDQGVGNGTRFFICYHLCKKTALYLQGKRQELKSVIHYSHFLASGTTKTIKSKVVEDVDEVNEEGPYDPLDQH